MSTILISGGKIQTMSQIWKWNTANFANLWIMSWSHTMYQMHNHFTVGINFPMVFQYLIQPVTRGNKSYTNQVLFSIIPRSNWAACLISHTTSLQFFLSSIRKGPIHSSQQMRCSWFKYDSYETSPEEDFMQFSADSVAWNRRATRYKPAWQWIKTQ